MDYVYENTEQKPLGTGYGPRTTASEIVSGKNLTGKIAIVTGGHSGLGYETARTLAAAGAAVILPARSIDKARRAAEAIPGAEAEELDLADPQSIDAFAARFLASGRPLHMLVHSAGIMAVPLQHDASGNELQFSTNFLGVYRLTAKLWPALKAAGEARTIVVTSRGHRLSDMHWDDLDYKLRPYDKWEAYGQSKTAAALFAVELDRRGRQHGVRAYAVHPGSIVTNLSQYLSDEEMNAMGAIDGDGRRAFASYDDDKKTVAEGAATIVWCAVGEELRDIGGVYCENGDIAKRLESGDPADGKQAGVMPWAVDPDAARKLWLVAKRLTGTTFQAE